MNIAEKSHRKMEEVIKLALARQGTRSREDWLKQLEIFHGSTKGRASKKQNSPAALTKAI